MTDLSLEIRVANLERRQASLARYGAVAEVDAARARVRVRWASPDGGDTALTAWIPWLAASAGQASAWRAPSVGEQVLLVAPAGSLEQAAALTGIYSDSFPAPASEPGKAVTRHPDGAEIAYDSEAHELSAVLPAGATLRVEAPGGLSVTGDTAVEGDLAVDGDLSATGNISARGNVSDAQGSMAEMRNVYNPHTHPLPGLPPSNTLASPAKMT